MLKHTHIKYFSKRVSLRNCLCLFWSWSLNLSTANFLMRSIWKHSSHVQYFENNLCSLKVSWQTVRGKLTVHALIYTLPSGWSVDSYTKLSEFLLIYNIYLLNVFLRGKTSSHLGLSALYYNPDLLLLLAIRKVNLMLKTRKQYQRNWFRQK